MVEVVFPVICAAMSYKMVGNLVKRENKTPKFHIVKLNHL